LVHRWVIVFTVSKCQDANPSCFPLTSNGLPGPLSPDVDVRLATVEKAGSEQSGPTSCTKHTAEKTMAIHLPTKSDIKSHAKPGETCEPKTRSLHHPRLGNKNWNVFIL
jgi:hypothetical protein